MTTFRHASFLRSAALIFLATPQLAAAAAPAPSPTRWIKSDDVRIRSGAGAEYKIQGLFARGAKVDYPSGAPINDFCYVAGEGQQGYVACSFLSTTRIARPRAGQDGVDAAQRWISGNAVTLREAARQDAAVVGRLDVNTAVKLLNVAPGGGYCDVQPATGASGFTACRYLVQTPVNLAEIRGVSDVDAPPTAGYDPERAFSLSPGRAVLEQYASKLEKNLGGKLPHTVWPRDEALERMKAHLALGIYGDKPAPFKDWARIKTKAAQVDLLSKDPTVKLAAETSGDELRNTLGLWGAQFDEPSGMLRVVNLLRALEFASARPSLFRSEAEVAPPGAGAEEASGRFGIIYRQVFSRRPTPKGEMRDYPNAGLYDMLARTQSLAKPVQRVQILRDGHLRIGPSVLRKSETYFGETDGPECGDWEPGFAYGDADPAMWHSLEGEGDAAYKLEQKARRLKRYPVNTVFTLYTSLVLAADLAIQKEFPVSLDRAKTGFVRGTHFYYDLDKDGNADIAIWEGQGKGPGHMDGPTLTDDRWYRFALVNINGVWKLLGIDAFGYGCGC